jgi:hypothetical protein
MLPRVARSSQQLFRCLRSLRLPLAAAARPIRLQASTLAAGSMSSQPNPGIFYRKPLPNPPCIPFSSEQGRSIFQQALAAGSLNCFFPLSEQFLTQDDPAFCGLSSMAMVHLRQSRRCARVPHSTPRSSTRSASTPGASGRACGAGSVRRSCRCNGA